MVMNAEACARVSVVSSGIVALKGGSASQRGCCLQMASRCAASCDTSAMLREAISRAEKPRLASRIAICVFLLRQGFPPLWEARHPRRGSAMHIGSVS